MSYRIVALIGLSAALIGSAAVAGAKAAEQVIVPFTCEAGDGDVHARPSQPQSYTIIGEREAAPFTACASDGSERCRTMMLHRFDIDCDGQRVGWPEFYTAISDATSGRAFIEGDRLLVRVRPQRTRRAARSRFQPPSSQRSFVVEMPDGFAPLRGTVARFKGGRSARNAPLRATRDPFSTPPPQRPLASRESVARAQPKPAAVKPIKQPAQKPARRTVIKVPEDGPTSQVTGDTPKVIKPTVVAAPKPKPSVKPKPNENSSPGKTPTKLKVVKAPPVQPKPQSLNKTKSVDKTTSAIKTKNQTAPETKTIVPKLLNGPKDTIVTESTEAQTAIPDDAKGNETPAEKPDSIADLLQTRGAKLRADAETVATTVSSGIKPEAVSTIEPAASPTLANTLAVLGIVAGLMLVFAYAAYHFLTPKSAPPLMRARAVRPAKPTAQDVRPIAKAERVRDQEPSLAGMAQPKTTPSADDTSQTSQHMDQSKTNLRDTDATSDKPAPPPQIEIPKHPEPVLTARAKLSADVVTPELTAGTRLSASQTVKKTEPTLSLDSATRLPTNSDKREPELPMPKLVAAKLKQPDFDESALLLPRTRQEALTALGVGESAGEDVIERVVAGLRQCWRPDESNDKAERKRRLQRMEQIETAWRILSEPQNVASDEAKHHPN